MIETFDRPMPYRALAAQVVGSMLAAPCLVTWALGRAWFGLMFWVRRHWRHQVTCVCAIFSYTGAHVCRCAAATMVEYACCTKAHQQYVLSTKARSPFHMLMLQINPPLQVVQREAPTSRKQPQTEPSAAAQVRAAIILAVESWAQRMGSRSAGTVQAVVQGRGGRAFTCTGWQMPVSSSRGDTHKIKLERNTVTPRQEASQGAVCLAYLVCGVLSRAVQPTACC
jgi:hypothetical protein